MGLVMDLGLLAMVQVEVRKLSPYGIVACQMPDFAARDLCVNGEEIPQESILNGRSQVINS